MATTSKSRKLWATLIAVGIVIAVFAVFAVSVAANASQSAITLYFSNEDFSLDPQQKATIDNQLDELAQATVITVNGYVQDSPPEHENIGPENLSAKRADAVAKYIQQALNQRPGKKQTAEYVVEGLGQPPFDFTFREARRVEVYIQK